MNKRPLKSGTEVKIKKGTSLWSTNPNKHRFVAGRTYTVKIHDSYAAYGTGSDYHVAEVLWVGTSGYWTYAALADVEVVQ